MNYTESFDQFASKVTSMDLALYAGVGLVLWVLFKDKLSPVQKIILDLVNSLKSKGSSSTLPTNVVLPSLVTGKNNKNDDLFFKLVSSWKQTRDLAVQSNCLDAVKAADQMFPLLGPNVCTSENSNTVQTK